MRGRGVTLEIFLNDLDTPWEKRPGFPAKIRFGNARIQSIFRLDTQEDLPLLMFEPEEISLFFGPEREQRRLISIDAVPDHLINAVLSIEDTRFYNHVGIDPKGVMRALLANLRSGAIRQGGSTITQQLAKNYFLTPTQSFSRKIKEFFIAIAMERLYEKNEILEIYLNEIYFGQKGSISVNGIGEAAAFYFDKSVGDLTLIESALLAGIIKAPNRYSPYKDADRARIRRNTVLTAMVKAGWLSKQKLEEWSLIPVKTSGFRRYRSKAPYFVDYVSKQLSVLYDPNALESLGLSIYTTLDTQVQMAAERALKRGLLLLEKRDPNLVRKNPKKALQGAIIVMQPKTGAILAMVGGRNYHLSQFNRVTQAKRQPGSTFKPFVYLRALETFTPVSWISNIPETLIINGEKWQPKNSKTMSERRLRLREALARSVNVATVNLAMLSGLDNIVATVKKFHFSTPIKPFPSMALGAFEVLPLELARAYSTFAAGGIQPFPLSLREVVDEKKETISQKYMTLSPVITPAKAFMMTSLLRSVVTDGTARSLKRLGVDFPIAGKTGTTNNYKDAWFIGYTPDLLALVWVGFDNGDPLNVGSTQAALPIFADLVKAIPHQISRTGFSMPQGVVKRWVCLDPVQPLIFSLCDQPVEEIFLKQNAPKTSLMPQSASKPSSMPQNAPKPTSMPQSAPKSSSTPRGAPDEAVDQKGP